MRWGGGVRDIGSSPSSAHVAGLGPVVTARAALRQVASYRRCCRYHGRPRPRPGPRAAGRGGVPPHLLNENALRDEAPGTGAGGVGVVEGGGAAEGGGVGAGWGAERGMTDRAIADGKHGQFVLWGRRMKHRDVSNTQQFRVCEAPYDHMQHPPTKAALDPLDPLVVLLSPNSDGIASKTR